MVIAEEILSDKSVSFVMEITEDFARDLNKFSFSEQKQINSKLERITIALEEGNHSYIVKNLAKLHSISLIRYNSSLYVIQVNRDLRILLFYENDPIFQRQVMTLLRVCRHQDINKVLRNLSQSFYQQQLNDIGEIEHEK